jgi:hypothetical protein
MTRSFISPTPKAIIFGCQTIVYHHGKNRDLLAKFANVNIIDGNNGTFLCI